MTGLADIALAFAKECLGWDDAEYSDGYVIHQPGVVNECKHFSETDLDAVVKAARDWCSRAGVDFDLHFHDDQMGATVWDRNVLSKRYAECLSDDPCHALMAACVEAARKMQEQPRLQIGDVISVRGDEMTVRHIDGDYAVWYGDSGTFNGKPICRVRIFDYGPNIRLIRRASQQPQTKEGNGV